MIEMFTRRDQPLYPEIFQQMYRQRYDIYVKRRRWQGLQSDDDCEIDQYDNDEAVYLLAVDEDENVKAGLRLLPTTGPHIFSDLFPHLAANGEVPCGEHIMELTRFYVAPHGSNKHSRWWLSGVISIGMFEYCLNNGITQITSVIDTFLLNQMLEAGWRARPLGLPEHYGEGIAVGVLIDVSEEAIEHTRRVRGVEGMVFHDDHDRTGRISNHVISAKSRPDNRAGLA